MQENWDYNFTLPDLRLLVIEPSQLSQETLVKLSDKGWGLCHVPRQEYLIVSPFLFTNHLNLYTLFYREKLKDLEMH